MTKRAQSEQNYNEQDEDEDDLLEYSDVNVAIELGSLDESMIMPEVEFFVDVEQKFEYNMGLNKNTELLNIIENGRSDATSSVKGDEKSYDQKDNKTKEQDFDNLDMQINRAAEVDLPIININGNIEITANGQSFLKVKNLHKNIKKEEKMKNLFEDINQDQKEPIDINLDDQESILRAMDRSYNDAIKM